MSREQPPLIAVRLIAILPAIAGALAIVALMYQVVSACGTYDWVDWDALYGRPHPVAAFIYDWYLVIEAALLIGCLGVIRLNRSLAFWLMAIPQILMTQTLQITYAQAIWLSHSHTYVDGREVPSHTNPSPKVEGSSNGTK
jgi:hypothetical protein